MIELILQLFGGGGGKSGASTNKSKSIKLGTEIYSSRGIKKDQEYLVIAGNGDKTIRTGDRLLSQIENKSLKYDDDLYHWVGSKGTYIIRPIKRRKK